MVDNRTFFSSKGIIQQAPLYLYKQETSKRKGLATMMLFEQEAPYGLRHKDKVPNIDPVVFENLEKAFNKKKSPEDILHYVYAVLYSNAYREKYAEFLKIDFPRIPFTSDYKLFLQMVELGEELTQLHLLKSKELNKPSAKYKGRGDDLIAKPTYDEKRECVFISSPSDGTEGVKYFEDISKEVWEYHIGGYQVMEKYLKDRKGRQMTDPATYCKIAAAIHHTIELQKQLDKLYPKVEKALIND